MFKNVLNKKHFLKSWEKWWMSHYSTSWFLNYSKYKTRVICITHVSHTPKKLSLNKIISLSARQDLLVIPWFCISSVLITVTGEKVFFYTALFCLLLIYYDSKVMIIKAKRKGKKIQKVYILTSLFLCPVWNKYLWLSSYCRKLVWKKSNMQKCQHYF